jgi:hypothetical protein
MAGLEDRILKKNIPGKYSWWDKEYAPDKGGSRSRGEEGGVKGCRSSGSDNELL